jgi:hypothetical protein
MLADAATHWMTTEVEPFLFSRTILTAYSLKLSIDPTRFFME